MFIYFCRIFEDFCLKRRGVQSCTRLRICVKKCNEHDISDKSCIFACVFRKKHILGGSTYPNYHLDYKRSQLLTERMRYMRRCFCDVSKVVVNLGYAWTMSAHLC